MFKVSADIGSSPVAPTRAGSGLPISVIVPTYRRVTSLRECLLGLANQIHQPAEILVVVRDEDDQTLAAIPDLAKIIDIKVVRVSRPGQTHALNTALSQASGEIIAFIDDDAIAKRDWLERIAKHYEDPAVGAVGGKLIVPLVTASGSSEELKVGAISALGRPLGNHHLGDGQARSVQWLRGANMSMRRELCRFDEELWGDGAQVANDSEVSLRVHAAGWNVVYEPAAQVFHNAAPRTGEDQRLRPTKQAIRAAAYNETLVLMRWLPPVARLRAGLFLLLVGVPRTPGPISAAKALATRRRPAGETLSRCWHSTAARLAAFGVIRSTRGAEDTAPNASR